MIFINYQGALHYSILYGIIALISLVFNAFREMETSKKKVYLIVTLGILALMSMFRSPNVGNDTQNYIALYNRVANSDIISYISNSDTEPGYLLYDWIIAKVFHNYQYVFIISSMFIYYSYYMFINKWVSAPGIFVCLFIGMNSFDFNLSTQRQAISIALLLFAFDYCYKRKLLPFLIITGLAISFHFSSIIYLLIYPLLGVKEYTKKATVYIFIGSGVIVVAFDKVLEFALRLFPKYHYYDGGALFDGKARLALILQLVVKLLIIAVSDMLLSREYKKEKNDYVMKVLSFIGISITVVSMQATALARFSNTFGIYPLSRYSNSVGYARLEDRRMVIFASLILFYAYGLVIVLLKTPEWFTTYPFHWCFSESW